MGPGNSPMAAVKWMRRVEWKSKAQVFLLGATLVMLTLGVGIFALSKVMIMVDYITICAEADDDFENGDRLSDDLLNRSCHNWESTVVYALAGGLVLVAQVIFWGLQLARWVRARCTAKRKAEELMAAEDANSALEKALASRDVNLMQLALQDTRTLTYGDKHLLDKVRKTVAKKRKKLGQEKSATSGGPQGRTEEQEPSSSDISGDEEEDVSAHSTSSVAHVRNSVPESSEGFFSKAGIRSSKHAGLRERRVAREGKKDKSAFHSAKHRVMAGHTDSARPGGTPPRTNTAAQGARGFTAWNRGQGRPLPPPQRPREPVAETATRSQATAGNRWGVHVSPPRSETVSPPLVPTAAWRGAPSYATVASASLVQPPRADVPPVRPAPIAPPSTEVLYSMPVSPVKERPPPVPENPPIIRGSYEGRDGAGLPGVNWTGLAGLGLTPVQDSLASAVLPMPAAPQGGPSEFWRTTFLQDSAQLGRGPQQQSSHLHWGVPEQSNQRSGLHYGLAPGRFLSSGGLTGGKSEQPLSTRCPICMEAERDAVFLCGHMVCLRCAEDTKQAFGSCPMCRKPIEGIVRIWAG